VTVTLFDLIAGAILLVSAVVGYYRGAVRELVTVLAFSLAALAAVFLLPFTGPLARQSVHPAWAGNTAAIVVVFIVAYIGLRVLGGHIADRLHRQAAAGAIDRSIGLAFGVLRALIFLGVFYLVFNAATPRDRIPGWIADGKLYPLARASGHALEVFAPKGMKAAGRLSEPIEGAVRDGIRADDTPALRKAAAPAPAAARKAPAAPKGAGYKDSARDALDSVVERAR
jgi:membrane protein required for colicin V production